MPESLSTRIHEALAERIHCGEWTAGSRLPSEAVLIGELDVSRSVLREALARLQAQGLIETRHGRGSYVADLSRPRGPVGLPIELPCARDVLLALELRIAIEVEAAGLAALRRTPPEVEAMHQALADMKAAIRAGQRTRHADRGFHEALARAAHSPHIERVLQALTNTVTSRPASGTSELREALPPVLQDLYAEHEAILRAIEEQDVSTAQAVMRVHLVNSLARLHAASALESAR
ncbi:FadR/GntR family transcriptional regulator [Caldimonas tepidiphila]|uniref:FadR/GntR family transcriptional regulator n=1 Tax=Caldimonas tepidiphila TaxID=2315841 RepID=UPI000E5A18D2|nr:FadR/GntR family transcriptional regulator [Caldimonas tepidiphila]